MALNPLPAFGAPSSSRETDHASNLLLALLINLAATLFFATMFSDPALKVVALIGFAITLVFTVKCFGLLVSFLAALADSILLICLFHNRLEAYGWLLQQIEI